MQHETAQGHRVSQPKAFVLSQSDSPGDLARREARAGLRQMMLEDAIRRRAYGKRGNRRAGPLAGLLIWSALGAGLVTAIAAAAELVG